MSYCCFFPKKKVSVLIVDDDSGLRNFFKKLIEIISNNLMKHTLEICVAENGQDAFNQFQQNPDIRIILSDHDMGDHDKSGSVFFEKLSKDPNFFSKKRWLIGCSTDPLNLELFKAAGADKVFNKPLTLAELSYAMQEFSGQISPELVEPSNVESASPTLQKKIPC